MHDQTKGLISINIAAVIFGAAALYGKLDVSPAWIVAARGLFGAVTLYLISALTGNLKMPPRQQMRPLLLTGGILAIHWLGFFVAVQWAGVAIATLTFASFPLFTIILEAFLKRRWPFMVETGAGCTIILAVLLLVDFKSGTSMYLWGAAAGITSAITYAWFSVTSKKLITSTSPFMVSALQNSVVVFVTAPLLFFAARHPDSLGDWGFLVLLGVVSTALMLQLFFYALQRLSASVCSGFVALEPVYAILLAWMFFNEPLTLTVAISGILIIGASFALLRVDQVSSES